MSRRAKVHPLAEPSTVPRLVDHPRARRSIARSKAWAGLAGLVLAVLLSLQSGLTAQEALARGIAGGLVAYVAAWAVAVAVWTQLARAELETHRERLLAQREQALEGDA